MAYDNAIAEFIDETKKMSKDELQNALSAEPNLLDQNGRTFEYWQDAYLGAIAEHLARLNKLEIPAWTENDDRFLHRKAFFDNGGLNSLNATLIKESPLAFRRRGIFTEARPLRRC
ncbi:hypothetical protein L0Z16_08455 [Burkholderia multivorans]|nr:hypothetical protein [Burkholderia multivorans]MCO1356816.1 hypothetical protein [Burkholderia multivorans]MCO1448919.1 hypothetical protein [Burkholderia multivorans]UQP42239.1 hypothetical protein L0Z16_08455 [Burkholderia multivorans]